MPVQATLLAILSLTLIILLQFFSHLDILGRNASQQGENGAKMSQKKTKRLSVTSMPQSSMASALATPAQLGQANAGTGRMKTLRSLLEGSGLRPSKESECVQVHGTW